jgi:hypothetical protein
MTKVLFFLLLGAVLVVSLNSFIFSKVFGSRKASPVSKPHPVGSRADAVLGRMRSSRLSFKKKKDKGEGGGDGGDQGEGFFGRLKSYIPGLRRSQSRKTDETAPELGYRFEIRLRGRENGSDRRHIITRIMRFFPDIKWETACDIVDGAFQNEVSVVRILNSKKEAQQLQSILSRADPPVVVEIFDTKSGNLVI